MPEKEEMKWLTKTSWSAHCHMMIDIETEIEGDDGYMNLYPIVKLVKPKVPGESRFDELELERRLGN